MSEIKKPGFSYTCSGSAGGVAASNYGVCTGELLQCFHTGRDQGYRQQDPGRCSLQTCAQGSYAGSADASVGRADCGKWRKVGVWTDGLYTDRFTYDKRVYEVTVRVTNGENGELETQVWASDEAAGDEKTESIVFTNNYRRPGGGGGGGDSDPDPDPSPNPNPNPGPGGPGTEPSGGDGLTEISDNETPLGGLTQIFEEEVPLGGLPKTGDTTMLSFWILLAVLSGCGLAALAFIRKRMD